MSSKVVALRQQIEAECVAMKQALSGYAVVSTHEVIRRRFEAIGKHQEQLTRCVGTQEAQRILYETYEQVINVPDG